MRVRSAVLITPLVFWACGSSNTEVDAGPQAVPDSGVRLDASPNDTGVGGLDGGSGDAQVDDAGFNADADVPDSGVPEDAGGPCTYPAGAVEPMTLDAVISPYSWATAIDPMGMNRDLDLAQVYCNSDQDYAWGQADLLLFVSSPAW